MYLREGPEYCGDIIIEDIGFPSLDMYVEALPLVIIGYTLLFGDLITGTEDKCFR